jgi:hypothetical protein
MGASSIQKADPTKEERLFIEKRPAKEEKPIKEMKEIKIQEYRGKPKK